MRRIILFGLVLERIRKLKRDEKIATIISISTGVGIVGLIIASLINLSDFITQLAVGLTLFIPLVLIWGFRHRIESAFKGRTIMESKNEETLAPLDPLLGKPEREEKGIRIYVNRDNLPKIPIIFSLDDLKSVSILSITSVILVLNYGTEIKSALSRGISFNFLILDPEDKESVASQKRNYQGKDIEHQINEALSELKKIRNGLQEDMKQNLSIRLYRDINIDEGMMIVRRNDENNSWLKVEDIIVGKDANSRPSRAAYYHADKNFFKQYAHNYQLISNKETTREV